MTRYPYAEWPYSIEYDIANAPTVDGYQVLLTLPWRPGMRRDFRDLRFRDPALRKCPYWIESKTDGVSAAVWVRLYAAGQTRLTVLYGNGAAVSESDGAAVFEMFDDFATLDTAVKWTTISYSGTVADGVLTAASGTKGIYSKVSFGAGRAVSIRATMPTVAWGFIGFSDSTRAVQTLFAVSNAGGVTYTYSTALETQTCNLPAGYHKYEVSRNGSANVKFSIDGTLKTTHATRVPSGDLSVYLLNTGSDALLVDWILVRKYQATEPVLTRVRSGLNPWSLAVRRVRAIAAGAVAYNETAEATLSLSGTGTGAATYARAAAATLALSGTGVGDGEDEPAEASLALSGTATGAATSARTASASLAHAGTVAGTAAYVEAAAATLAFSGAGAGGAGLGETAEASLAFSGAGAGAIAYGAAGGASLALSGVSQYLHWIDFDTLPATTATADPVTGYPVTYPTGTVAIPAVTASVRRGVSDVCWQLTETVDGVASIPITSLRATKVIRQDQNGTARCVFFGVVPGLTYHLAYQADATSANGYDYGWYLSQQYVPSFYRIMPATMNPADFVTAMLGGNFWESTTGVRPYRIATVTAWGTAALPAKEFVFEPRTTKWEAIQELAEYCGFVFFTKWIPVGVADVADPDPSQRVVQVNAVDFDAGEGVGYHDVDAANLGGALRTAEGVDIERFPTERGASVGWIRDGEWLTFTRTFDWTGRYAVSARVAAATEATATYWTLYLDGVEQWTVYVGAASTADGGYRTGAYNVFVQTDPDTTTAGGATVASAAQYLDITEGEHVIKVVFGGNVGAAPNNRHQNFAGLTLTPEGAGSAAGADTLYEPVAYWVADANIDSTTAGLDLPAPVVISDPGQYPRDGVEVLENANERYNSVTVRGHSESGTYFEYTASYVSDGLPREHFEESDRIVDAASAQTYALALLEYYRLDQKSYRLSLPQRFDLSLYQLITFVGHAKLPAVACRIVDVEHHSGHQDDWTTIEIIPNTTWLRGRKLRRMLFPSAVHETEAIIDHALASLPQPHIGTCATAGTDTGTFTLEEGGTMTARIVD